MHALVTWLMDRIGPRCHYCKQTGVLWPAQAAGEDIRVCGPCKRGMGSRRRG